ncbi:glycoside hydrolase superfamily [Earliella scabrosa]|nr:glycoside hydrolase superfamily [Earliella scabrosa]
MKKISGVLDMMALRLLLASLSILAAVAPLVGAFDISRSDNVAVYWGQKNTIPLSEMCNSPNVNIIMIGFVIGYDGSAGASSLKMNLAGNCDADKFMCQALEKDIKLCQDKGKLVLLSLGGGDGDKQIKLADAGQARAFGQLVYDRFLGGSDAAAGVRPFGAAVLDGFDFDIEAGTTDNFDKFVDAVHAAAAKNPKGKDARKYWFTAAPQCPWVDKHLEFALNHVPLDAVFVQFYNNVCGLDTYFLSGAQRQWNFETWHKWATTTAPNKNVKVFIGAPASPHAGSHYVTAAQMGEIIKGTRSYSSFGGVMLWDAYWAKENNNYDRQIKNVFGVVGGKTAAAGAAADAPELDGTATVNTDGRVSDGSDGGSSQTPTSSGAKSLAASTGAAKDGHRIHPLPRRYPHGRMVGL